MSVQDLSPRSRVFCRAASRIGGTAWRVLIEPIARWHRRRATIEALSELDDRMLADIGIKRSEIAQVALGRMPRRFDSVAAVAATGPAATRSDQVSEMKQAA